MDISGLGLSASSITSDLTSSKLTGTLEGDYSNSSDQELMEVCKEFEAYFTEQMYKAMEQTIPKTEETSQGTATLNDYIRGEQIKQISSDSTEQQGMGLAQMLFDQMKRNESV